MKKKDVQAYRSKSIEELSKEVRDIHTDLVRHQVDRYTKQSKNVRENKVKRLKIAVLQTLIREKMGKGETV